METVHAVTNAHAQTREQIHVMIGPPAKREDTHSMMSLFFSREGKHVVCGGTTAQLASAYLGVPLQVSLSYPDDAIPAIGAMVGVDLVTEGIITITRVLEYAKAYLQDSATAADWRCKQDGASLLAQLLLDPAADIWFFVGQAVNPTHQDPTLPMGGVSKVQLVRELADCLEKLGKTIRISYF